MPTYEKKSKLHVLYEGPSSPRVRPQEVGLSHPWAAARLRIRSWQPLPQTQGHECMVVELSFPLGGARCCTLAPLSTTTQAGAPFTCPHATQPATSCSAFSPC